ncbi:hypothetical protein ElyMa_002960800 [Elysia marginata]|uniref:Uncharacterized protein n=1 Tax=Elysia marginata TaxID=1093978 RepID=A0AAV4IAX6_9GAST|nr:hypothetical protein ElyMa_002960800 [Elysia marginata]
MVKRPWIRSRYLQQYLIRYLFVTAVPEPQQLHQLFIKASKLSSLFLAVMQRKPEPELVSEYEARSTKNKPERHFSSRCDARLISLPGDVTAFR